MKKILALAAVAALTAGVSAYAANPFSDVTADDWAYQAVSDLSAVMLFFHHQIELVQSEIPCSVFLLIVIERL